MAGAEPGSDAVTVLTDTRRSVRLPADRHDRPRLRLSDQARAGQSAGGLQGRRRRRQRRSTTHRLNVGMIHGSFPIPGKFDQDEVLFTDAEVAASGLDYLALGHWHSFREGRAGNTTWAYSGAPEPVALDQDGAGQVLLVELSKRDTAAAARCPSRRVKVGRTTFEKLELDAAAITSQGQLEQIAQGARRPRPRPRRAARAASSPTTSTCNVDELEKQLQGVVPAPARARLVGRRPARDRRSPRRTPSLAHLPATSVRGSSSTRQRGDAERAAELREALRLGILLLDDPQRVTLA